MKNLLLLLIVSFMILPNVRGQFVIDRLSCDDIEVRWTGTTLSTTPIFNQLSVWPCAQNEFHSIAGARITRFRYQLQKRVGNQFVNEGRSRNSDASRFTFNNLSDGVYRVEILRFASDGMPVFSNVEPCGTPIGFRFNNNQTTSAVTPTVEIGPVSPSFSIGDPNFNNILCASEIDAAGGVFISTAATYGETQYWIDICQQPIGALSSAPCQAWTSTYWVSGEVPSVINILTDVWQLHHPSWRFWGERQFRVKLAVAQANCTNWASTTQIFRVQDTGPCRIAPEDKPDITVYPNPSMDQIQLMGLEDIENEVPYNIIDATGRRVSSGVLLHSNYPIDVRSFSAGIYILSLNLDGNPITKRFSVLK